MLPKVSIVIPTLNASRTLKECLSSISAQDFPKNKIELLICDGGSTDETITLAKSYGAKILENPLKTGEAGKAVGLRHSKGEIIAFIDSDNILPEKNWLKKMTAPFEDKTILCAEPLEYTWRAKDNYITRYCALMGLNDPLVYFIGNYDRKNLLDGKWTRAKVAEEKKKGFLKVRILEKPVPTIGANGFLARKTSLKEFLKDDYFFDVDVAARIISRPNAFFAKVDTGIIHLYSGSFSTFLRKQKRRIKDFLYYSKSRKKSSANLPLLALLKFAVYSWLLFPLLFQALKGFVKKRDNAWFFHIPATSSTLSIYVLYFLKAKIFGVEKFERKNWSQ